ncbi:ferritin-like domain-containing protein [Bradyrhizobium sp.]
MTQSPKVKLIPRNVAALRRGGTPRMVAGNPVSTRLESGVGNCYPGLECDLRNLERRFFPFLEVDIDDNRISVVNVDRTAARAAAQAGILSAADLALYTRLFNDIGAGRAWRIAQLSGLFGPLGQLTLDVATLQPPSAGQGRRPPDAWTAIRMLREGSLMVLNLRGPGSASMQLEGNRNRYLDDNGALAGIFLPGELTQSLCSPWTHDFRDCGCYYWASNHPDIAQPPLPTPMTGGPQWDAAVPWERQDRTLGPNPPAPARGDQDPVELDHLEINGAWQMLNFVVGRREIVGPFSVHPVSDDPLASGAELERFLRYAAGVELTVAQEYLTAAYSLRLPAGLPQPLSDDIRAAHAELMRIAVGEMRHLRAVNDVLRLTLPTGTAFTPALRPASQLPGKLPGSFVPAVFTAATKLAIQNFIDIEAPSVSVDSVYARILATLERDGPHDAAQSVRTIMAEGEDHFETFRAIQVWLSAHQESDYLRSTAGAAPPPSDPDHQQLQTEYRAILEQLHQGYTIGNPAGAPNVNGARTEMVGPLNAAAEKIATRGFLVVFDPLTDPRFAPIGPP